MTRIRTQIRSARIAYRTARYPGDLSAELLPSPSVFARALADRRYLLVGGVGASAAAAAVILSLLLSRATNVPQPWPTAHSDRGGLVDWLPIAPDKMPLPHFKAPGLPLRAPELRLDMTLPAGVERYQDLAMQYRVPDLQVPEPLRHTTVPTIPTDLPTRGVEWFQKVWTGGEKSA
jgi:hypothetical protein